MRARCRLPILGLVLSAMLTAACFEDETADPTGPSDPYAAVDLPVPLLLQQRQSWCWLAAGQMVIAYRNLNQSLPQCAMLEIGYALRPGACCLSPVACDIPGTIQQIQFLVTYVGGRYSAIGASADPLTLASTLRQGAPVVAFLRSPFQAVGHFVVIRGIRFDATHTAYVHINDPLSYYPAEVPFAQFSQLWGQSLVVY